MSEIYAGVEFNPLVIGYDKLVEGAFRKMNDVHNGEADRLAKCVKLVEKFIEKLEESVEVPDWAECRYSMDMYGILTLEFGSLKSFNDIAEVLYTLGHQFTPTTKSRSDYEAEMKVSYLYNYWFNPGGYVGVRVNASLNKVDNECKILRTEVVPSPAARPSPTEKVEFVCPGDPRYYDIVDGKIQRTEPGERDA